MVATPGGNKYDKGAEDELLDAVGLSSDRSGVKSLKNRLPAIFSKLIETNLPGLKEHVCAKAQQASWEMEEIFVAKIE